MKFLVQRTWLSWWCLTLANAGVVAGLLAAAHFNTPASALVVLNGTTGADQYSSVLEYSKVDFESPVAMQVVLPNGQRTSIPRAQIGLIFQYPDSMRVLAGAADTQVLSAKRAEAAALIARFPKAKAVLDLVIAGIDADLQKLAAGQVRYSGVWQSAGSSSAFVTASSPHDDLPSLAYKGQTFHHLTIARLDNGAIALSHEGGVVRVPLTEASPELLRVLRSKPVLFKSMKALPEFTVGTQKLSGVILLGIQNDIVLLWHQAGVLSVPRVQMTEVQLQALTSTNPGLHPPAIAQDRVSTAVPAAGTLELVAPTKEAHMYADLGPRLPGRGWQCSTDEKKQWQIASREPLHDMDMMPDDGFAEAAERFSDHPPPDLPKLDPTVEEPGYSKKALTFINSRIAPYEIGYNLTNECLVVRLKKGDTTEIQAALVTFYIDANVRIKISSGVCFISLEGRDGAEAITLYRHEVPKKGVDALWRDEVTRIKLRVADPNDAPRVAKALSNVLALLGARYSKI